VTLAWRLGRPALMGVTAATAGLGWLAGPGRAASGFLLATVLFHYAGVMVNDAMDVNVDRLTARRHRSPMVNGEVSPAVGLAAGLGCAAGALAVTASGLLAGAVGAMLLYNLAGKRSRIPLVMDLVQGVGWGLFVLWAASAGPIGTGQLIVAAAVTVYMAQVNAVHGGVRDAVVDAGAGRHTTALFLGVIGTEDGDMRIPARMRAVAYGFQAGLIVLAGAWVLRVRPITVSQDLAAAEALGILFAGLRVLRRGMRSGTTVSHRERDGAWHIALTFLAIAALSAVGGGWWELVIAQVLGVLLLAPLMAHPAFRRARG
jgi:hypothetical protein